MRHGIVFIVLAVNLFVRIEADLSGTCSTEVHVSFKSINREPDASIINNTHVGISQEKCSSFCTKTRSPSLYYVKTNSTCHCNHGTDDRTNANVGDTITYGYVHNPETLPDSIEHFTGSSWHRLQSPMGGPCFSSRDCVTHSSKCHRSTCRCRDAGFVYNPSNGSCVSSCMKYGSTFQRYAGHRLVGFDNDFVFVTNERGCKESCVNVTDYVCRQAEYIVSKTWCWHTNETMLTQPDSHLLDIDDYVIFSRDCT